MKITYIISDLHISDTAQPYEFTTKKLKILLQLISAIENEPDAGLIVAGDFFDLTAMTPPKTLAIAGAAGDPLAKFFAAIGVNTGPGAHPAVAAALARTEPSDFNGIAGLYPGLFPALGRLASKGKLTLIPGNHDFVLSLPVWQQAFQSAVGSGGTQFVSSFAAGSFLVLAHGNEYDPSNVTNAGWKNPGAAITSALYNGIVPALLAMNVESNVADAIPAVRPEENIITGLQGYLPPAKVDALLRAFVTLLHDTGYFGPNPNPVATFFTNLVLTPALVASRLRNDNGLDVTLRHVADDVTAGRRIVGDWTRPQPPEMVVFGHTHVLDAGPCYVNTGTWIDHVEGLEDGQLVRRDSALPVLRIDGTQASTTATLHDLQAWPSGGIPVLYSRQLWRYR